MTKDEELKELRDKVKANGSHADVTDPEAYVRELRGTETERDKELKDAGEWLKHNNQFNFESIVNDSLIPDILVAYHHHRLETAWVSVKERLPEDGGEKVLVAIENDFVLLIGQYVCDQWLVYYLDGRKSPIFNQVTHWQPLPELKDTKHDQQ